MAIYNTDTKPPKKRKTAEEMIEEGKNDPLVQENERERASEFRKKLFGSAAGIAAVTGVGKSARPSYDRYRKDKKEFAAVADSEKRLRRQMDEAAKNTADMKKKQGVTTGSKPGSSAASTPEEKPSAGSVIKSRMKSKENAENFAEQERLRLGAIGNQRGAMQRAEDTAALRKDRLQRAEQDKSNARSKARQDAESASQEESLNLRKDLARREAISPGIEQAKAKSRERLRGYREERNAQQRAAEREQQRNPNIASNPSSGKALKRDLRRQERQGQAAEEQAAKDKAAKDTAAQAERNRQADLKRTLQGKQEERRSLKSLGEQIQNPDDKMRAQIKAQQDAELKTNQKAADEVNKRISQNRLKNRLRGNQEKRRSTESLGEQIQNPDENMQGQIQAQKDAEIKARMQRLRDYNAELRGGKSKSPEAPVAKESPAPAAKVSSAEAPIARTKAEENLIKARIARQANREATVKKPAAKKAPPAKKPPVKKMNCGGSVKRYSSGGKIRRGDGICRVKTRGTMR